MPRPLRRPLTEGDVPTRLRELALPMVVGIFSVTVFNLVDAWFLGKLGTVELAAMGFTFPLVSLIFSLTMGLGVGTTSVVSRALGSGDEEGVRCLVRDALALAVAVVAVAAGIGVLTIDPVFRALGARGEVLEAVRQYMEVWYLGMPFLVIPMVGNSAIRATGDARFPAKIMAASAAMNALLDPLFIFGAGPVPAFGIRGAAIASVLARVATLALSLRVLLVRERLIARALPSVEELVGHWRRILRVGVPAAMGAVLAPLSISVVTRIVADFGPAAVAGFGTGSRVYQFLSIPLHALGASMTPFIGQNWGGAAPARIEAALDHARRVALGWGVLVWVALLVAAPWVAAGFSRDPAVIAAMASFLRIALAAVAFEGFFLAANSTFVATDRSLRATALSAFRMVGLLIPLAYLGASVAGARGVFLAYATATAVGGLVGLGAARSLIEAAPRAVPVEEAAVAQVALPEAATASRS